MKTLNYVLSIIMVAVYLIIFVKAFDTSRANDIYEAYYIDKTIESIPYGVNLERKK